MDLKLLDIAKATTLEELAAAAEHVMNKENYAETVIYLMETFSKEHKPMRWEQLKNVDSYRAWVSCGSWCGDYMIFWNLVNLGLLRVREHTVSVHPHVKKLVKLYLMRRELMS